ncbi:MAG: endonuclease domain-containing protein [Clostridia bacterium]|nr:endonuclease domain-containing protein [Clostridia bacterium]
MERKHNKELTGNARALRKNMTKEERHLWYDFLRTYEIKFFRQRVIDGFIVDFYCHKARLVIELDGSQHYTESELNKDKIRTEKIEERNLTVIRIPNNYVNKNFREVCEYIDNIVKQRLNEEQ